jgi:hypothetical protein
MNSTENTPAASQFMLLFHGPDWDTGRTREETQHIMDKVMTWFDGLNKRGIVRGGAPLARAGKLVSGKSRTVADGPFAESKEVVGGYLLVAVDSLTEATAIARDCPTLDYGISVEVRPMLDECPIATRLREQAPLAAAA